MIVTVQRWSGREIRALREAKRMSIRSFAATLGVSERQISKWEERGADIVPRPVNQEALDSLLASSDGDVHARFSALLAEAPPQPSTNATSAAPPRSDTPAAAASPFGAPQNQVRHPIDGKLMGLVDAGTFLSGEKNESVSLPAFYIDVFPTTNDDYARFVRATGHTAPQHWVAGQPPGPELSHHPVVFVSWDDANAYATWAAKALPTGLQWEKAARGPHGDIYPWGNQPTPAKCNVRESGLRSTTPVDRYHSGVSPYGIYDMCGNVWEWCSSGVERGRYELKGSAFTSPFFRCTPSTFNDASNLMVDDDTGFRCVTPAETMRALLNLKS
jgi:formylglycine-generating enzyme required for sulfatase activity